MATLVSLVSSFLADLTFDIEFPIMSTFLASPYLGRAYLPIMSTFLASPYLGRAYHVSKFDYLLACHLAIRVQHAIKTLAISCEIGIIKQLHSVAWRNLYTITTVCGRQVALIKLIPSISHLSIVGPTKERSWSSIAVRVKEQIGCTSFLLVVVSHEPHGFSIVQSIHLTILWGSNCALSIVSTTTRLNGAAIAEFSMYLCSTFPWFKSVATLQFGIQVSVICSC